MTNDSPTPDPRSISGSESASTGIPPICDPFKAAIAGGIYGALVGDALGVPVEFSDRSDLVSAPVRNMRSGGHWQQDAGTWSDDGGLLLSSAEALIPGYDAGRMGQAFVNWLYSCRWTARRDVFDVGSTTRIAIMQLAAGVAPESAGPDSTDSNGNGSLMRILPVALRLHSRSAAEICGIAMRASRITHGHVRAQIACAIYCLIVVDVLHGRSVAEATLNAENTIRRLPGLPGAEIALYQRIFDPDFSSLPPEEIQSTGYVLDTLEAAVWCALRHDNFRDTVLAAVNLGSDTDTTGCVVGGLAGVRFGIRSIPDEWLNALPITAELNQLVAAFAGACAP
jgi:ADP-ribosyl-[dinitrogen reductase] hydrolase